MERPAPRLQGGVPDPEGTITAAPVHAVVIVSVIDLSVVSRLEGIVPGAPGRVAQPVGRELL